MYFPINNTNHPGLQIAFTEQVKHLAECVEKILQKPVSSLPANSLPANSLPYGIPGPSGSQEEPIILSSDEEIKIKTEKVTEEEIGKSTKKGAKKGAKKAASRKTVSKAFYFLYFDSQ